MYYDSCTVEVRTRRGWLTLVAIEPHLSQDVGARVLFYEQNPDSGLRVRDDYLYA